MIVFGPVPSRRLGRSLGINNIPAKVCTYSCIYCQLGAGEVRRVEPCSFYLPKELFRLTQEKVQAVRARGDSIDYLTFVSDGEPTLDSRLEHEIEFLRSLDIKIGVITNSSLLWREDVRKALNRTRWVSTKVDAADSRTWRKINRPHADLRLEAIQEGLAAFAESYAGEWVTETMLVQGVNDSPAQIEAVASFLGRLRPSRAYLAIPIRPPAMPWVHSPDEEIVLEAHEIFKEHLPRVECLVGYEGNAFGLTGDFEEDLLSITAVHPMKEEAVRHLMEKANGKWSLVEELKSRGILAEARYRGDTFFIRKFPEIKDKEPSSA